MKKAYLSSILSIVLLLTSCSQTTTQDLSHACDAPDYTYAESIVETWGNLTYNLPHCWTAKEIITTDKRQALSLQKLDDTASLQIVRMSGIPIAELAAPLVKTAADGTTTYSYDGHFTATTTTPDDADVQEILASFKDPLPDYSSMEPLPDL